jgi:hypothetical protein
MKYLIFLITSLFLIGCATTPEPLPPKPVVLKEYVYPDCGNSPKRSKVEHRDIHWFWMEDTDGDTVYYLTPKGYEDLSFNTSEIIKGAKELKTELAYYLECIEVVKP